MTVGFCDRCDTRAELTCGLCNACELDPDTFNECVTVLAAYRPSCPPNPRDAQMYDLMIRTRWYIKQLEEKTNG